MATTDTHRRARPLEYFKNEDGYGWLCDKDADLTKDLRDEGCSRCDEMGLPFLPFLFSEQWAYLWLPYPRIINTHCRSSGSWHLFTHLRKSRPVDDLIRQLKEADQKIRILFEITRFVSSLLCLQDVLDAIVDLLMKEFRLDACSIRLLDEDGHLRIKSHKGLSKAFIEQATRKPTVDSYSGECFLTGKILIINDSDQIDKPISTNRIVCENIRSFAVTPIRVEGETIGVLVTSSRKKNYFHERFNDVIYIIANQIGIAIRISQLYEEISNLNKELEIKVEQRTSELKEKTRKLIEAEKLAALGKMSQRVADELRNSLTVIGGFARRLSERVADTNPSKEYVDIIVEEVKALEEKVSKLIKVDSYETG